MNRLLEMGRQCALRLSVECREKRRWSHGAARDACRVFYGYDRVGGRNAVLGGGIVKVQDLATRFPQHPDDPNLLYLVSSALPPYASRMAALARKSGGRVVLNQNGVAYRAWCGPSWERTNQFMRSAMQESDFVIYQSRYCQRAADHFLGRASAPSAVLLNPVDTRQFLPGQRACCVRAPVLLTAGTHCHAYRVECVIQALGLLRRGGIDARLVLSGVLAWRDDPSAARTDVENWIRSAGVADAVTCTGPYTQAQAVALMQQADVLVHAKVCDPCPRLVVEAMACGLPVVYSATGGTPELVGLEAGVGIPGTEDWEVDHPPAPELLAGAVMQVLATYDKCALAARQRAVTQLDVEPWLDRHAEWFARLLARRE